MTKAEIVTLKSRNIYPSPVHILDHLDGECSVPPSQTLGQDVKVTNTFFQSEERDERDTNDRTNKGKISFGIIFFMGPNLFSFFFFFLGIRFCLERPESNCGNFDLLSD